MFDINLFKDMKDENRMKAMLQMLEALVSGDDEDLTKLCNASALINALIGKVNWCGFYLYKNNELMLGPFQGMPACTKIEIGKGVCGAAAENRKIYKVDNVHEFPGHIQCDSASNSEIVLPIVKENKLYGVLDIDSDLFNRFTEMEEKYLSKAVYILIEFIDFEKLI